MFRRTLLKLAGAAVVLLFPKSETITGDQFNKSVVGQEEIPEPTLTKQKEYTEHEWVLQYKQEGDEEWITIPRDQRFRMGER